MAPIKPDEFPREQLVEKLKNVSVQLVFAYRDSPTEWEFRRARLHADLPDTFRSAARDQAVNLRDDRVGRAYDPEWELRRDEFLYLDNQPPAGGNFFTELPNFAQFEEFQEKKRIRQPKAWVLIAQLSDKTLAYFGARIVPSRILRRNSRELRLVYRDTAFDTLDDTVISLETSFDWIAWQGVMIVLDAKGFHAVFRDIPALIKKVDQHLGTVTQHVGIDNLSEFSQRIKDTPAMMVKLARIIERADMHTRPPEVLRRYGEEYGIEIEWSGDRMVFEGSVERQWNILRLLDEARTLGPVTGKHWETSTKVEV
jgi:hypothetical protein